MSRSSEEDPLKLFRFIVEMGGARAGFSECSALESETDVVEYREGGDNTTVKKSPGLTKFSDLTLKRGQVLDRGQDDFYKWYQAVYAQSGDLDQAEDFRRDIDIVQYNRARNEVLRWRAYNCFPSKFKATGDFNATSNDNSISELTLACEGWELVQ